MASQSAILSGFCYGGLSIGRDEGANKHSFLHLIYMSATTAAMAFGLIVIIVSSLCNILGPGLALRGSQGPKSMHTAIEVMKEEAMFSFKFFMLQLVFFNISSITLMWVLYRPSIAIFVTTLLVLFLTIFVVKGMGIFEKLYVDEDSAVSGQF